MSFYYQEKVVHNRMPYLAALLLLAVLLLTLAGAVGAAGLTEGSKTLFNWLLLAVYILCAGKIIKNSTRRFKYSLMQDELIIREMNPGKPRIHDRIHLNKIRSFQPMPLLSRLACISEDDACPASRFWKLTYEKDGRIRTRFIHPSNSLAEKIKEQAAA